MHPGIQYSRVAARVGDTFTDRSQFASALVEMVDRFISTDYPPETYLEGDWRFRVRDSRFNIEAMLKSGSSVGMVQDAIGASLFQTHKELQSQQQNGEWGLVAWAAVEGVGHRRARTPLEQDQLASKKAAWRESAYGKDSPGAGPLRPSTKHNSSLVSEAVIVLRTVWVDQLQNPELDNWNDRTGKTDSPMAHGKIPARLREGYAEARQLIKEFTTDYGGSPPNHDWKLSNTDLEEVTKLRAQKPPVPWRVLGNLMKLDPVVLESEFTERTPKPKKKRAKKSVERKELEQIADAFAAGGVKAEISEPAGEESAPNV